MKRNLVIPVLAALFAAVASPGSTAEAIQAQNGGGGCPEPLEPGGRISQSREAEALSAVVRVETQPAGTDQRLGFFLSDSHLITALSREEAAGDVDRILYVSKLDGRGEEHPARVIATSTILDLALLLVDSGEILEAGTLKAGSLVDSEIVVVREYDEEVGLAWGQKYEEVVELDQRDRENSAERGEIWTGAPVLNRCLEVVGLAAGAVPESVAGQSSFIPVDWGNPFFWSAGVVFSPEYADIRSEYAQIRQELSELCTASTELAAWLDRLRRALNVDAALKHSLNELPRLEITVWPEVEDDPILPTGGKATITLHLDWTKKDIGKLPDAIGNLPESVEVKHTFPLTNNSVEIPLAMAVETMLNYVTFEHTPLTLKDITKGFTHATVDRVEFNADDDSDVNVPSLACRGLEEVKQAAAFAAFQCHSSDGKEFECRSVQEVSSEAGGVP